MEQTTRQINEVIKPAELLKHWQGHRELTRRTIEAFPEKEFFEFSIGGMRTYAEIIMELLGIAAPGIKEIVTGQPGELVEHFDHGNKKANILKAWDEATEEINKLFPQIASDRFHEVIMLFGKYENPVWASIFYFIDNEIHHRGQGYVYLRALGIEPPFFWDRP
jgi:uncharacterized damage-inducible protein DinB